MKRSQWALAGWFLAIAGLLVGTVLFTYFVGQYAVQANRTMAAQEVVLRQLEVVLSTLKDAETGQRGYLLVGEDAYLEPYNTALSQIRNQFETLHRYGASVDLDPRDVARLERLAQECIANLERGIQIRRTQGLEAASAFTHSGEGKAVMDAFRAQVAATFAAEQKEFSQASRRADWARAIRTLAFIATAIVNLAFLAWAYRRISREMARREAAILETTRQKELLGTTLASIGDAVLVTDSQGCITFLNPEAERLTGWKNVEAHGQPLPTVFRIINESTRQPAENPVEKVLRVGTVVGLANHTILLSRDGREIPIDDSAAPIRVPNGPLFGVVLVFRDFTEQKQTEERLRELTQRLTYHVDHAPLAVIEWGPDMRLTRWSGAAERVFGWKAEEVLGKRMEDFRWVYKEDESQVAEVSADLQTGRNPRRFSLNRNYRKDGSTAYCEWYNSSLVDASGNLRSILSLVLDVTERKQAEQALQEAQAKLQAYTRDLEKTVSERTAKLTEMVSELQHVSYAITHDMRAPLRAMNAFATALKEECAMGLSPAETQDYCRRILVGANRLDKLITDALSYTKAVLLEMPMQPVDLSTLVQGLLDTYPNLHPDHADIQIQGRLPTVLGNEALLTQCFSNLLGNAVKFIAPGVKAQVRIWAEPGGKAEARTAPPTLSGLPSAPPSPDGLKPSTENYIRICLQDNGIGIPKPAQKRLFGMFQKLDNQYDGTGIGLAIVRKVVERMGGRVGAQSEPGKGSCFWVELRPAS